VDPVGYLDMLSLQCDAAAVVTDSGGVQEEACMLGTPCVTVRRNTERWVTLEVGANRLVDAERTAILDGIQEALAGKAKWPRPVRWDISVSQRIVKTLLGGIPPLEGCTEVTE
jgi:UDP-N-acetylglucosamine 2-epimerase (non-hydrolysing)